MYTTVISRSAEARGHITSSGYNRQKLESGAHDKSGNEPRQVLNLESKEEKPRHLVQ